MKRSLYILSVFIFASSAAFGQVLFPTFNFEDWRGVPENPRGWFTSTFTQAAAPVTKSTDSKEGNFAMKLETVEVLGDLVPGYAITGIISPVGQAIGFPYTKKLSTMSFHYKYTPDPSGDSMNFFAGFTKFDTISGRSTLIGFTDFYEKATVNSYVKQDLVFEYLPGFENVMPDSMFIQITNTNQDSAKLGSVLFIDDIMIDTVITASVRAENNQNQEINAEVYPNPLQDFTNFAIELSTPQQVTIKIYDVLGKEVATVINESKVTGKHIIPFDASRLENGMYFYRINAGNAIKTGKLYLRR